MTFHKIHCFEGSRLRYYHFDVVKEWQEICVVEGFHFYFLAFWKRIQNWCFLNRLIDVNLSPWGSCAINEMQICVWHWVVRVRHTKGRTPGLIMLNKNHTENGTTRCKITPQTSAGFCEIIFEVRQEKCDFIDVLFPSPT